MSEINLKQIVDVITSYITIVSDLKAGKNLERHLKDVEGAMIEVDASIKTEKANGRTETPGLYRVRQELEHLKCMILDKIS